MDLQNAVMAASGTTPAGTAPEVTGQVEPAGPAGSLDARLAALAPRLDVREADAGDATAWTPLRLGGRTHRFARGLTFTPYASAQPCSARCRFCSENLAHAPSQLRAARLRPGPGYFDALARTLAALRGLELSWSLSGLEATDDPDWLLSLLDVLGGAERSGLAVASRVLYSNGAGFASERGAELIAALQRFRLSWVELSRHSHDAAANQSIMRFRPGEPAAGAGFGRVLERLAGALPFKLVCIVQRGGIDTPAMLRSYLDWAASTGASAVIFREFSRLDPSFRDNATSRYVASARVPMDALLDACLDDPALAAALAPHTLTRGYYYWNLRCAHPTGMEVVFEASDYARMLERHDSGRVYKLVWFANGNLCAGWDPDRNVLLRGDAGAAPSALVR